MYIAVNRWTSTENAAIRRTFLDLIVEKKSPIKQNVIRDRLKYTEELVHRSARSVFQKIKN